MPYPYPQYNQFMQPQPDMLQQLRQYQQPQQNPDERIWVTGKASADAYLVAPNSFVRLWDSQEPVFYEKRADATGKPYMEVYEYKRKSAQMPSVQTPEAMDYKAMFDSLEQRIKALEEKGADHE